MFPHHFVRRNSSLFENAVLEILRGDGGYLLPHLSIELPSICALDRLPLRIGERDYRNTVRVCDRDRGSPLRHGSTVTTVPLEGVAQGKHTRRWEDVRRLASRPRAFQIL